jgi:hypothetical protein
MDLRRQSLPPGFLNRACINNEAEQKPQPYYPVDALHTWPEEEGYHNYRLQDSIRFELPVLKPTSLSRWDLDPTISDFSREAPK